MTAAEAAAIAAFRVLDVGDRVGESMKSLAQYHQIVAITHLPQIAALGESRFVVQKDVESGRTKTHIRRLDEQQRTVELATLLSGPEVTEAALESARELRAAGRGA